MPRRVQSIFVLLVVAMWMLGTAGSAGANRTKAQTGAAIHYLRFSRTFGNCQAALNDLDFASGRYVLFNCGFGRVLLVDDRTEKRVRIKHSLSCGWLEPRALGGPSILFFCGGGERVYNIATGKWKPARCDNSRCLAPQGGEMVSESVGAHWVERDVRLPGSCAPDYHDNCGPIKPVFVNIRTGRVRRSWPKSPATILDLDSPSLVRHLCPPLRVPANGSLAMEGRFALITTERGSAYLQRCGSPRHTPLLSSEARSVGLRANERMVFWAVTHPSADWRGEFAGVLLPGVRRFTATVPPKFRSSYALAGVYHMYIPDNRGRIWVASFPPTSPM